jgi:hypothetical protein
MARLHPSNRRAAGAAGRQRARRRCHAAQPLPELPEQRGFVRLRLNGPCLPQLLLRFGTTDQVAASVRRRKDVLR